MTLEYDTKIKQAGLFITCPTHSSVHPFTFLCCCTLSPLIPIPSRAGICFPNLATQSAPSPADSASLPFTSAHWLLWLNENNPRKSRTSSCLRRVTRQVLCHPMYLQTSHPPKLETHPEDLSQSPMMIMKRGQRQRGRYGGIVLLRSRQVAFQIMARSHLNPFAQSQRMLLTGVA